MLIVSRSRSRSSVADQQRLAFPPPQKPREPAKAPHSPIFPRGERGGQNSCQDISFPRMSPGITEISPQSFLSPLCVIRILSSNIM